MPERLLVSRHEPIGMRSHPRMIEPNVIGNEVHDKPQFTSVKRFTQRIELGHRAEAAVRLVSADGKRRADNVRDTPAGIRAII